MDNVSLDDIKSFSKLFDVQNKLNEYVGVSVEKYKEMDDEDKALTVRNYCSITIDEILEIQKELGLKWWKGDSIDFEKAKEESVDLLHLTVSILCLLFEMDVEEVVETYLKKNKYNFRREDWDVGKGGDNV